LKKDDTTNGKKKRWQEKINKHVMAYTKSNNYTLYSTATANLIILHATSPFQCFVLSTATLSLPGLICIPILDALEKRVNYLAFLIAAGSLAHFCRSTHSLA